MRYPSITQSACQRLADLRIKGLEAAVEPDVVWLGSGDDLDLRPIEKAAELCTNVAASITGPADRDQLEGSLAARLWDALSDVPFDVLDDPGFWRYLSLAHFWDWIAWREEKPFQRGNYLKYVDGVSSSEGVLPRMYLRASAVGGSKYDDLLAVLPNATDFWRSHVIRVRTGTAPSVVREFVKSQARDRLTVDPLRELAKAINRTWSNTVPQMLSEQDAKNLIEELRGSSPESPPRD